MARKGRHRQVRRRGAFTGYQPVRDKIAFEMVSLVKFGAARGAALAVAALGLGACASVPAPVSIGGARGSSSIFAERPPFNPDAPPRVIDYSARLQCVPFARQASGV